MLDRVPVPTDNIYKFIALFSLVILIFSLWASFTLHNSTNEVVFKNLPEIETLKKLESRTHEQEVHLALMQRKIEIAKSDSNFISYFLGGLIAVSFWGLGYGFRTWHKDIQPLADATARAQLRLLRLQAVQLRLENRKLSNSLKAEEAPPVAPSPPQPSVLAQVVTALLSKR